MVYVLLKMDVQPVSSTLYIWDVYRHLMGADTWAPVWWALGWQMKSVTSGWQPGRRRRNKQGDFGNNRKTLQRCNSLTDRKVLEFIFGFKAWYVFGFPVSLHPQNALFDFWCLAKTYSFLLFVTLHPQNFMNFVAVLSDRQTWMGNFCPSLNSLAPFNRLSSRIDLYLVTSVFPINFN